MLLVYYKKKKKKEQMWKSIRQQPCLIKSGMPRSKALIRIIIIPLRCYLARTYQSFVQLIRAKEEKRKHISIISKKVTKILNALNFPDQDQNFKILNPSIISCVSLKRKEETRDYISSPSERTQRKTARFRIE